MSTKRVYVLSDHFKIYGELELERGQVFELQNKLNDQKLLGWNYVRELEPKQATYTCKCGREFEGGVTDMYVTAHNRRWQGQCSAAINVDGPSLKSRGPRLQGTSDPDKGDTGWDVGFMGGDNDEPPVDPYAGQRSASGKEKPKRVSLGG